MVIIMFFCAEGKRLWNSSGEYKANWVVITRSILTSFTKVKYNVRLFSISQSAEVQESDDAPTEDVSSILILYNQLLLFYIIICVLK